MSLSVQLNTMLAMIAMGSFFGATLDTYQRFLKRGKRKKVIVFVNDILFWSVQGLIIFYVLFLVNYGELRFYLLIALLCGFAAYNALMKQHYLNLLELVISFVQASARFFYRLIIIMIYKPIKWIVLLLLGIMLFILKLLLGLVKTVAKVLLWMLKIVLYPVLFICRVIWKLIPKQVKGSIGFTYGWLTRHAMLVKRCLTKAMGLIKRMFRK